MNAFIHLTSSILLSFQCQTASWSSSRSFGPPVLRKCVFDAWCAAGILQGLWIHMMLKRLYRGFSLYRIHSVNQSQACCKLPVLRQTCRLICCDATELWILFQLVCTGFNSNHRHVSCNQCSNDVFLWWVPRKYYPSLTIHVIYGTFIACHLSVMTEIHLWYLIIKHIGVYSLAQLQFSAISTASQTMHHLHLGTWVNVGFQQ